MTIIALKINAIYFPEDTLTLPSTDPKIKMNHTNVCVVQVNAHQANKPTAPRSATAMRAATPTAVPLTKYFPCLLVKTLL